MHLHNYMSDTYVLTDQLQNVGLGKFPEFFVILPEFVFHKKVMITMIQHFL